MIGSPVLIGSGTGSGASVSLTTSVAAPRGSSVIVRNIGRTGFGGMTDSDANTYAGDGFANLPYGSAGPGSHSPGFVEFWSTHRLPADLAAGSTITLSGAWGIAGDDNALTAWYVTGIQRKSGSGGIASVTGAAPAHLIATSAADSQAETFAIALLGCEVPDYSLTLTSTDWNVLDSFTTSGSAYFTGAQLEFGWKIGFPGRYDSFTYPFQPTDGTFLFEGDLYYHPSYSGDVTVIPYAGLVIEYQARVLAVCHDRGPDGRIVAAQVLADGTLNALRYDDANPPALAETVEILAASHLVLSVALLARKSAMWDVTDAHGSADLWDNAKQGRATWHKQTSSLASLAGPWSRVTTALHPVGNQYAVGLYEGAASKWTLLLGSVNGSNWDLPNYVATAGTQIVADAGPSACLRFTPSGRLLCAYVTVPDPYTGVTSVQLLACDAMPNDGSGAWVNLSTPATDWDAVTLCVSRTGLLVLGLWDGTDGLWRVCVGTWDPDDLAYLWSDPSDPVSVLPFGEQSSLRETAVGEFEWCLVDDDEAVTFLRCGALSSDGSGVWA